LKLLETVVMSGARRVTMAALDSSSPRNESPPDAMGADRLARLALAPPAKPAAARPTAPAGSAVRAAPLSSSSSSALMRVAGSAVGGPSGQSSAFDFSDIKRERDADAEQRARAVARAAEQSGAAGIAEVIAF
jgi:hypothetical protein